jgi:plasmid maintenance system killer protein
MAIQLLTDKGRHAWAVQEMVKGEDGPGPTELFLFNLLLPDQHAGWQFNPAQDTSPYFPGTQLPDPATAALLTDEELRTNSFFEPFIAAGRGQASRFPDYDGEELFAPLYDADANTQAAQDETQYKLLAEAIPALSFAAAANEVPSLNTVGGSRNIHLEALQNGWPSIRSNDDWLHSDLKNIALPYISKFYDRVVSEGGLNAE